jgi:hypothetical protein
MNSDGSAADVVGSFEAILDGVEHEVSWQAGEVMLDSMLGADLDPAPNARMSTAEPAWRC